MYWMSLKAIFTFHKCFFRLLKLFQFKMVYLHSYQLQICYSKQLRSFVLSIKNVEFSVSVTIHI